MDPPMMDTSETPLIPATPHPLPRQCLKCHIIFCTDKKLQRHMKVTHPAEYEQSMLRNSIFICYICGHHFSNSAELKAHQNAHTEKKPYKCQICGQAFSRPFQLTSHQKSHLDEDGYPCADCGKVCRTMLLLKDHRHSRSCSKDCLCSICNTSFKSTKTLLKHIKLRHASLVSAAIRDLPAGHQLKGLLTKFSQQGAIMDKEQIRRLTDFLVDMQKVNSVVKLEQVPHHSPPLEMQQIPQLTERGNLNLNPPQIDSYQEPSDHKPWSKNHPQDERDDSALVKETVHQNESQGICISEVRSIGKPPGRGTDKTTDEAPTLQIISYCSLREEPVSTDVKEEVNKKEIKVEEGYDIDKSLDVTLKNVHSSSPKQTVDNKLYLKTCLNTAAESEVQLLKREEIKVEEIIFDPPLAGPACQSKEHTGELDSPAFTDCKLEFTDWEVLRTHLHQNAPKKEEEEAEKGENEKPAEQMDLRKVEGEGNIKEDVSGDENKSTTSSSNPSGLTLENGGVLSKRGCYSCFLCGKFYKYLGSFMKHQEQHNKQMLKYQCTKCRKAFNRKSQLLDHMKVHRSRSSQVDQQT
ncbi:zinc finger protein 440-like isoform X2 [Xyrichtys novacula]|uniref:Zinc finger protein 440-like isoform X2 n=1 Tax=Xyrichtys novacula TaxID=13765 RepID=A0AAV1FKL0_XYRNO|nr:zinc finger protein 440-like isoform X2 [Xyrichtys novacula]